MSLSFTPWHGIAYQRFNILETKPDRVKKIGRILAPNEELALVKARELFPDKVVSVVDRDKPKDSPKPKARKTSKPKVTVKPARRRVAQKAD